MTKKQQDQAAAATSERRAEPRIKAGVSVVWITQRSHPIEACLLDLSPHGARLRIPEMVPVGTNVRIEAHELLLSGTVRRCCRIQGAYEVGMMLAEPMDMVDQLRRLDAALLAESEPVNSKTAS